jgi:hypothetical protein
MPNWTDDNGVSHFGEHVSKPVHDAEKVLARVSKLVMFAGRAPTEPERRTAAQAACAYLDKYPTPLRWRVPAGTAVRVLDAVHYKDGDAINGKYLRKTHARGDNWFFEAHRVKGAEATRALALGFLLFKRHNMAVFVEAGKVEVHL